MGIDAKLTLPPGTAAQDVALVFGVLVGNEAIIVDARNSQYSYLSVDKAKVEKSSVVGCDKLEITDRDGWLWSPLFMYEWWMDRNSGRPGSPGLMMRSTAKNIAILYRLGEFFGGQLDINDCDAVKVDHEWPDRWTAKARVNDDQTFTRHHREMFAVQPVTDQFVATFLNVSSYD
jgi:hypothetical protein